MTVSPVQGGALIVAIDPGKTTGWALYDTDDARFVSGETAGRFDFYRNLRELASSGRPLEVVAEAFTITARTIATDRQYDALYIIGYVEAACEVNGWPFSLQEPGTAKGFASNEKLAVLGWRNPTPNGHADDAARHLFTYLATKRPALAQPLLARIVEAGL